MSAGFGAGGDGEERRGAVRVDGRVVDHHEAALRPDDHGLLVGDGVFETLMVRDGHVCFWARHAARLGRSLETTGIGAIPERTLALGVEEVMAASGLAHARLRITVTSGPGPAGLRRGAHPTVVIRADPLGPPLPPALAVTLPWPRNERGPLAGVKSTSYAEAVTMYGRVTGSGADEGILADTTGRLCEALTANIALTVDERRITPGLTSGCLPGIVREVLLEAGVVDEADLPASSVFLATEVVLTSSVTGIRPVAAIDGRQIPIVDGPLAKAARTALRAAEAADAEAASAFDGADGGPDDER